MAKTKEQKAAEETAATQQTPAEATPKAAAGTKQGKARFVQLADQDTGFFDPATGFQVVRGQKVELSGTIGNATNEALQSGRLLIVED